MSAIRKLVKLRLDERVNQSETKILVRNEGEKGVDDALINGLDLREISFTDWLSTLGEKCLEEVRKIFEKRN